MKNPNVAKVLKVYRRKNHLTVNDVVDYLAKNMNGKRYSIKTIYGWESGVSQPSADVLLYLCKLYKINDVLGTFGWNESEKIEENYMFRLTSEEANLIWAYRMNPAMKKVVRKILEIGD